MDMNFLEILRNNPELASNLTIKVNLNDLGEFAELCRTKAWKEKPEYLKEKEIEQPISQTEAAKFLAKSRQTMISWRKKGIISGHKLGGRIYYLKSELLEAMNMSQL